MLRALSTERCTECFCPRTTQHVVGEGAVGRFAPVATALYWQVGGRGAGDAARAVAQLAHFPRHLRCRDEPRELRDSRPAARRRQTAARQVQEQHLWR